MSKKLAKNVIVDGVLYGAGTVPPKDVADEITNPKAWDADGAEVETPAEVAQYDDMSPAKLKAEIKSRNESRADEATHINPEGTGKPELVAALVADDAAQPGA